MNDGNRKRWWVLAGALLAVVAGLLATAHAGSGAGEGDGDSAWTGGMADRIACQAAIEQVYWSHRKRGPDGGSFEQDVPQRVLRRRAEDQVRMPAALEQLWGVSLTTKDVQAELDRMAAHSKAPQRLRELFAALDDDPRRIAGCLAAPALAKRRLVDAYYRDPSIHATTLERAKRALAGAKHATALAREAPVASLVVLDKGAGPESTGGPSARGATAGRDGRMVHRLTPERWQARVDAVRGEGAKQLRARRTPVPQRKSDAAVEAGQPSRLKQARTFFYAEALVEVAGDTAKILVARWPKRPFDDWWEETRRTIDTNSPAKAGETASGGAPKDNIELPEIAANGCEAGAWSPTETDLPDPRFGHTAVWTGSEMIVWGGQQAFLGGDLEQGLRSGGVYDPATDSWELTPVTSATPAPRSGHTAVWSGDEMIVWGGFGLDDPSRPDAAGYFGDGAAYDPVTGQWRPLSGIDAPAPRSEHTAVWAPAAGRMIVWGGRGAVAGGDLTYRSDGAIYDPEADTWTPVTTDAAPEARAAHTAVWTGTEMIVWGGFDAQDNDLGTGGVYDPALDAWSPTASDGAPIPRSFHTAVWTGDEMIVWGGSLADGSVLDSGSRYDPQTDAWEPTGAGPPARDFHTAVWTGGEMLVWGGANDQDPPSYDDRVWRYDPAGDSWTEGGSGGGVPPLGRGSHTAVWTGDEMIVWGGLDDAGPFAGGGRYAPGDDSWSEISLSSDPPFAQSEPEGVWTGSELIVWGGASLVAGYLDSGHRYDPATDQWTVIAAAPDGIEPRTGHTAVWTGDEMIVWGGFNLDQQNQPVDLNTGGRYDPAADQWAELPASGAPSARSIHTAVWSGSEMIVWGGVAYQPQSGADLPLASGARYVPGSGWQPVADPGGALEARGYHTAVWSGSEMIVWGGFAGNPENRSCLPSGARYAPGSDTWQALPSPDPGFFVGCGFHTAVWAGDEMIVWGGEAEDVLEAYGGRYAPGSDAWTAIPEPPFAGLVRGSHAALWTGSEMIIWGGQRVVDGVTLRPAAGGHFDPESGSWTLTGLAGEVPKGRSTPLMTPGPGSQLLVWGGFPDTATGGAYCFDCAGLSWFTDGDGDGFGAGGGEDPSLAGTCNPGPGFARNGDDCDDTTAAVSPARPDLCDGNAAEDCDPSTPDGTDDPALERGCDGAGDADSCQDGVATCDTDLGRIVCDDRSGDSEEICDNGLDDDCDGWPDEPQTCVSSASACDGDGSGRCDGFDLGDLGRAFGSDCYDNPARYDETVDMNGDCFVDGDDLTILANGFGRSTPSGKTAP